MTLLAVETGGQGASLQAQHAEEKRSTTAGNITDTYYVQWLAKNMKHVPKFKESPSAQAQGISESRDVAAECTSLLYTKGHWQRARCGISRNVGIGTSYTMNQNVTCPENNQEGIVQQNCSRSSCDWIVSSACKPLPFEKTGFCEAMAGRSMLLVGDSITQMQFWSLVHLTGAWTKHMEGKPPGSHHEHGDPYYICDDTYVAYVRNDILAPIPAEEWDNFTASVNSTVTPYFAKPNNFPWVDLLKSFEVLVLNTGLHLRGRSDATYEEELTATYLYLQKNYRGQVIYRLSVPGHPQCENATESPVSSYEDYLARFPDSHPEHQWGRIIPRINVIERKLATKFNATVLDVVPMTVVRPDTHSLGKWHDCLHYKLPSVVDHWNWLLYNAILGRFR